MANEWDQYLRTLLSKGWIQAGSGKHVLLRCPCGEHQLTVARTPSDCRALDNLRAQARKCPCMQEAPTPAPEQDGGLDPAESYTCFCCKKPLKLDEYRHTWVAHGNTTVCLAHPGVPAWHGQERAKERLSRKKGIKTL